MANHPHKSMDATQEALSAIEDALAVREGDRIAAPDSPRREPAIPSQPTVDLFGEPIAPHITGDEPSPRRPANDDRAAIGKILQSLQRRPSRMPYIIAVLFALAWVGGAGALGYIYREEIAALFGQPDMRIPGLVALGAAVLVPVTFFFVVAQVIRRTQDLRLATQTIAEVAMRFAEPETAARDAVVSVGQAIRREVAAMGDGVERALARAAELETLVHNEVSALERAYNDNEVRIRDLLTELSNQRTTLVDQAELVRTAISSVHLDLSQDITSVGDIVAERVNEVAHRVTRTLTEKGEHITLALGHAGDSMIDALSERGSTLLQRLETTSDQTTNAIASASERLTNSLNFKTDNIHDEFADLSTRLQQMMTSRLDSVTQNFSQKSTAVVDLMTEQTRQITDTMADTGSQLANTIAARAQEVSNALRTTGDSIILDMTLRGGDVVTKMEQTADRVTGTISERSAEIAGTFHDNTQALLGTIDTRRQTIVDSITERTKAFDELFAHHGTELTEKISRDSSTLGDLIVRHIGEFDRTVRTFGGELVERLGQRSENLTEAMRNYVDSFDSRVTTRTEEVSNKLQGRLSEFEAGLETRASSLATTLADGGKDMLAALDKRVGDVGDAITRRGDEVAQSIETKVHAIDQTLGTRAAEVANTLDSRIGQFEQLLVGRAETVTEQIESRTKAAADVLNSRVEQLSATIKENTGEAERALAQLATMTAESIRTSAGEAERSLTGVSAEVARNLTGKAEEIATTVAAQASAITAALADGSSGVLAVIDQKGQQFAADISHASQTAVRAIDNSGLAFTRAMAENGLDIAQQINTAGETAVNALNRTLNELEQRGHGAIEQSRQVAAQTVSDLHETNQILRADSMALFERLREANLLLQDVLSRTHSNISTLENSMMLRVAEFVSAVNRVNETTNATGEQVERNIGTFRDTAAKIVADLGGISQQFDAHGRDLGKAAELVSDSNRRTTEAVDQRRQELEALVNALDSRTDDISQRLSRFSALLDDSLEFAANKTRDVARLAAEASADSSRNIGEQIDQLQNAAEAERQRTVDALRQVYDRTVSDSRAMFTDAAERFNEVALGMKQMAADVQRELGRTREELRRGIVELPQDAADSAAQMRRVLVDQIEALAELNRIVSRHGRAIDTVEPARRAEAPLALVGGRAVDSPPPRPAPRSEATPPPRFDFGSQPSRRPEPAPAASSPAARGWLTDLLNRASRDEDAESPRDIGRNDDRSPRHAIESLDSLSVDIARMIDHDAASDLWDRYKRGERNVFTRRLYTLQGQKAFDEIQRKYRSDREFKQTVDRYIGEFERLLEEVSRDDRGQLVARTYLTSETGKVYTMLAHAAGRLS